MDCSLEEVVEASEATQARATESFESRAVERHDKSFTLAERIGAEDDGYAAAEASATAEHLLAALSERERRAILLRFHHDMTQAEIARHIGCSQMHVSHILRRALARLADEAASDGRCSLLRSLDRSQR